MTELTQDSISLRNAGIIQVTQPKRGVRFTSDSVILADFCRLKRRSYVLEPGAGTGVISMLLAKRYPHARFLADENEPLAHDLLCKNIAENGFAGRMSACNGDILTLTGKFKPATFDAIIANPPYVRQGSGHSCPSPERRAARQELMTTVTHWISLSSLLKSKGRLFLIFPAARLAELLCFLRTEKLEPKRLRCIHPYRNRPASLVMIESTKDGGTGLEIVPPLVMHEEPGKYTSEMTAIYDLP